MVTIRQLSVSYGTVSALDELSLDIPGRGVFGLLGRNGAGKTTTIRSILGLVKRDSGEVLVCGKDPSGDSSVRRCISVLFSEDGLVPALSVADNLRVWAGLFGKGKEESAELTDSILTKLSISDMSGKSITDLSTGNRRIVALARTFMLDSDLYILDEPTSSLDPVRAAEVRKMISLLAGVKPIVLSTHNLHEAEELCGEIAIIESGKLVMTGRPGEMGADRGRYLIRSENYPLVYRGDSIEPAEDGCILLESDESASFVLAELIGSGNRITEFRLVKRTLSEVFLRLMTGEEGL
jgi:ABC-2 type transport system ATP-binding protein